MRRNTAVCSLTCLLRDWIFFSKRGSEPTTLRSPVNASIAVLVVVFIGHPSLEARGVRLLNGVRARVLLGDAANFQSHLLLGQGACSVRPRVSRLLCVSPSVALICSCVRHTVLLKRVPV